MCSTVGCSYRGGVQYRGGICQWGVFSTVGGYLFESFLQISIYFHVSDA